MDFRQKKTTGSTRLKANFEEEIKKIATSIQKEFEIEIDNRKIICEFCNEFEKKIKSRIEDY